MNGESTEALQGRVQAQEALLQRCQEWFELIDVEESGYATLDEAIADIYGDDGFTLELYRDLKGRPR